MIVIFVLYCITIKQFCISSVLVNIGVICVRSCKVFYVKLTRSPISTAAFFKNWFEFRIQTLTPPHPPWTKIQLYDPSSLVWLVIRLFTPPSTGGKVHWGTGLRGEWHVRLYVQVHVFVMTKKSLLYRKQNTFKHSSVNKHPGLEGNNGIIWYFTIWYSRDKLHYLLLKITPVHQAPVFQKVVNATHLIQSIHWIALSSNWTTRARFVTKISSFQLLKD